MIIGLGIDIIEIERINNSWQKFGMSFVHKILHADEIGLLPPQTAQHRFTSYLAARFAAKEAGAKALGTGFTQGISFQDFIVSPLPSGKPIMTLQNQALAHANSLGVTSIHLSLTHSRHTAGAVVILETLLPSSRE